MKKISLTIIMLLLVALSLLCFRASAAEWTEMDSGTLQHLIGVWGSAGNDVFAVGAAETIQHFDGTAWSQHYPLSSPIYYPDVWGSVCLQKVLDKSGIKIREGFRFQIPFSSRLSNH
jgi:hypothetical protein